MKVFSWVCVLALLSATNAESRNDILARELDGENADWYNRMTQELGSVPPPPPPTPPPTPEFPTPSPTKSPTKPPTPSPTKSPTKTPTMSPTNSPTKMPVVTPTSSSAPSDSPSVSNSPTDSPSVRPTIRPSVAPSVGPTPVPTMSPSSNPTNAPTPPPTPNPTNTPTQSPTMTPLELVQKLGVFFLQRCQGDCNADTDCAFGLVCQQRAATTSVPGCSGNPNLLGNGDEDYCITPPQANRLVLMGDDINGVQTPPGAFPLGKCQGDCNNDDDCSGNLLCRQRDDDAPITGCVGRGAPGFDYCYAPGPNDLVYLGDDDEGFVGQGPPNLAKCRGDCDEDTDCQNGLVCFQRSFNTRTVPGCSGDAFQVGNGDDDFCIQASSNTLNFRGDNGQPAGAFPLGNCQGDCDDDSECAGNLRCFIRDAFENVPGCQGDGVSGFDYCANFGRDGDEEEDSETIEVPEEEETEAEEEDVKEKESLNRFFLGH